MATVPQLEMLAGKAVLDGKFLEQMLDDPQAAANSVGISLTANQVKRIQAFKDQQAELQDLVDELRRLRSGMHQPNAQHISPLVW